jgi:hypothetical protein
MTEKFKGGFPTALNRRNDRRCFAGNIRRSILVARPILPIAI